MSGRGTKSITLGTPVLQHGDAVLHLVACPLVHRFSVSSGGCRHGLTHSAVCPHVAGLPGLNNEVTTCHVNPSNRFGDVQQSIQL